MSNEANTAPAALRKADVTNYWKLKQELEELDASRDAIRREMKLEMEKIELYVREETRRKRGWPRSIDFGRFRLTLDQKKGSVKWKDELIRVAGNELATELQAAAPLVEFVTVEPIS